METPDKIHDDCVCNNSRISAYCYALTHLHSRHYYASTHVYTGRMAQDKTIRVKHTTWRRLHDRKPLEATMDEYISDLLAATEAEA